MRDFPRTRFDYYDIQLRCFFEVRVFEPEDRVLPDRGRAENVPRYNQRLWQGIELRWPERDARNLTLQERPAGLVCIVARADAFKSYRRQDRRGLRRGGGRAGAWARVRWMIRST